MPSFTWIWADMDHNNTSEHSLECFIYNLILIKNEENAKGGS